QLIFYFVFCFSGCTDEQIFESKTVCVGDDVTLTCARKGSGSLFWIRTVSGKVPQVLGKTYSLEPVDPRIEATEERETFVLSIKKAKLSDTAVYYCMKIHQQKLIFLNGTDLRVEGTEPDVTTVPTSDPVHTEASGCLQCSTLSDSETKLCPEEKCVCCFGAGAESQPSFNYTQGNSVCGYDKNPEGLSTKKCICTFLKNVTSSDNGTYYCAVATCEQIISGNGSKLHSDESGLHAQKDNTVLFLLCAALAISLIVIAFLIYLIKQLKKSSYGHYGKQSHSFIDLSNIYFAKMYSH
uniref:Ig-like domain-containing protein n=1 Tax=Seriola lalandi dorsalis TaxID=1841481 RepID=A0A3B4YTV6_SERLL